MAYLEVLQECSKTLGKRHDPTLCKEYNSMFTFEDHKLIRTLDEIPDDCKLILVSEYKPPRMKRTMSGEQEAESEDDCVEVGEDQLDDIEK